MSQSMYETMRLYLQVVYLQGLTQIYCLQLILSWFLSFLDYYLIVFMLRVLKRCGCITLSFIVYPEVMDSVLMYLPEVLLLDSLDSWIVY